MKVLLFSYLFPNSKLPTRGIFNLSRAKALIKAGCEVIVVAPVSINPNIKSLMSFSGIKQQFNLLKRLNSVPYVEDYEGIKAYHPKWVTAPRKIFWKHLSSILHLFIGKKLDKIISGFQPDLIISTWLNPFSVYGKYFNKYPDIKHFAIAEGSDVLIQPFEYKGWEKIERSLNEHSDYVIPVSQKMKYKIEKSTRLRNLKLIQNGYEENIFSYNNKQRTAGKYFKIINVANFNFEKGHDVLLDALQYIKIPVKLTLVGNGPLFGKYKKMVEQRGLQDVVTFLGQIPHNKIPELLIDNDLFCLSSRSEGFPAAPLEAMACGLPVVAVNVGGLDEMIIPGFNGFLCKPGSNDELAEKIVSASKMEWDNKRISEWVLNNFSWSAWSSKIIDTYNGSELKCDPEIIADAVIESI